MDNGVVQRLFSFLVPGQPPVAGSHDLRQVIAGARASAQTIQDSDKRNLWLLLIQLIEVQYFASTN